MRQSIDDSFLYGLKRARKLAENPVFHGRTKHIDIRHHFVREVLESGDLDIEYSPSCEMAADVLTKGLPREKHEEYVHLLELKYLSWYDSFSFLSLWFEEKSVISLVDDATYETDTVTPLDASLCIFYSLCRIVLCISFCYENFFVPLFLFNKTTRHLEVCTSFAILFSNKYFIFWFFIIL